MVIALLVVAFLFLSVAVWIFLQSMTPKVPAERPLLRACPVCGTELKIGENILAERTGMMNGAREKIIIKGCAKCLRAKGGLEAREADYLEISQQRPAKKVARKAV